MRRTVLIPAAVAALAAGCIETEQAYTLNPDGSGKVLYEVVTLPSRIGAAEPAASPEAAVRRSADELIKKSRGVAAWKDVQFARRPDGRVWFRGTAYFDRFADLKLHLMKEAPFVWRKDEAGGRVLQMKPPRRRGPVLTPPPRLTDEEVARRIRSERARWAETKRLYAHAIAALRIRLRFRLPGHVREIRDFTLAEDGTVRLGFDGEEMFRAMDALVADDGFMEEAVRSGVDVLQAHPGTNRAINRRVFGLRGPTRVRVVGRMEPLFDYEAEVAEARREEAAMLERLGLDPRPAGPERP